jgi:ACS family tartrate transporter-like MFS transporter
VLLGISVLFYLTDRPAKARWLTEEEREWLIAELAAERRAVDGVRVYTVLQAFANLRTLALAIIWLGTATAALGLVLFLPQILKQLGLSTMMIGFAAAIPYVAGSIGMVVWGYVSDRMQERRWNLFGGCFVAAVGLTAAGLLNGSLWALVGMSVATVGIYGMKGPFWPLPSTYLSGMAAAAAIAAINSIGNLGGYVGPFVVGWIKSSTGSFSAGLYFLGGLSVLAAIVALVAAHPTARRTAPAGLQTPAE